MSLVTIVMYHYVRDLKRSRYPGIKGLDLAGFRSQLDYINKHYAIITMEELIDAAGGGVLPRNPALLTFDDGYIDHYINVFPVLDEAGLQGSFFPPAGAVENGEVLDVNKIHFLLASGVDTDKLLEDVSILMKKYGRRFKAEDIDWYVSRFWQSTRFDSHAVAFIKVMLQRELPPGLRKIILNALFEKYVTVDERAFSAELYLSMDMIRCMRRHGMFIGSHGYGHRWLNKLSSAEQLDEINKSLAFLGRVGADTARWVMCYPYGAYDAKLLKHLRKSNCSLGLTTEVAIADLAAFDRLTLPRLDTNDFPKNNSSTCSRAKNLTGGR